MSNFNHLHTPFTKPLPPTPAFIMHLKSFFLSFVSGRSPCGVVVNKLIRDILVREFELLFHYYIHFWVDKYGKSVDLFILAVGLMLQLFTYKDIFSIK